MNSPWIRRLAAIGALALPALLLAPLPSCAGGTDLRPEMPSPAAYYPEIEDMELPEVEEEGGDDADGDADGEGEGEGEGDADAAPPAPVSVVAGQRTAIEGRNPTLRITAPRQNQRFARGNVMVRISVRNWPLQPAPGQHVHLIVDNEPYIAIRDVSSPLNLNELVQRHLGHELAEGTHVLRAFPSRGHHESVKTSGAFASVVFHFRRPTAGFRFVRTRPLLTYSRPKGCNPSGSRVMLDFYVANTTLSATGNRVHYSIDGAVEGDITSWVPHFIENLPDGEHTITLSLRNQAGEAVAGPFNSTERTIRVGGCQ